MLGASVDTTRYYEQRFWVFGCVCMPSRVYKLCVTSYVQVAWFVYYAHSVQEISWKSNYETIGNCHCYRVGNPPPIGARANHYARCLYSKGWIPSWWKSNHKSSGFSGKPHLASSLSVRTVSIWCVLMVRWRAVNTRIWINGYHGCECVFIMSLELMENIC